MKGTISIIICAAVILWAAWFEITGHSSKQKTAINSVFHARATAVTNSIVYNTNSAAQIVMLNKIGCEGGGPLSERAFSAALAQISTDGCPADFKDAWNGYVTAWKAHCLLSTNDRLYILIKPNHSEGNKFEAVNVQDEIKLNPKGEFLALAMNAQDEKKDVESAWIRCQYVATVYSVEDTSDFDF
jgi:hypothetical protein